MSIKYRIALGAFLLVMLIVFQNLIGLRSIRKLQAGASELSSQTLPIIKSLSDVKSEVLRLVMDTNDFLLLVYSAEQSSGSAQSSIDREREEILENWGEIQVILERNEILFHPIEDGNEQYLLDIRETVEEIGELSLEVLMGAPIKTSAEISEVQESFEEAEKTFSAAINAGVDYASKKVDQRGSAIASDLSLAMTMLIITTLAVVVIILFVSFLLSRTFLSSINYLITVTRQVSVDEYSEVLVQPGPQEFRLLKEAFEEMAAAVQDRTRDLSKVNEQLADQQGILQSILDNMGDGVVVADENGRSIFANPTAERLMGMEVQDVPLADWPQRYGIYSLDGTTVYSAEDLPLNRAVNGQASDQVEMIVKNRSKPDGVWLSLTGRPLIDERGNLQGGVVVMHDVTTEKQAAEALQQANVNLERSLDVVEQHNLEMGLLSEMSEILQSCSTLDELFDVIGSFSERLFPSSGGMLCTYSPSRDVVEAKTSWGIDLSVSKSIFSTGDCWALRRGRAHSVQAASGGVICGHLREHPPETYVCVPLTALGEVLGIFHLQCMPDPSSAPGETACTALDERLAHAFSEQIALALSNMRLWETLQNQAIRDPLTGLFNRRYLEEIMTIQLHQAARDGSHLGVVMFDIDHFKTFNDDFGHAAGDVVLNAIGDLLKDTFRGSDISCRYGGEEFILLLQGSNVSDAAARAEKLRLEVSGLHLQYERQSLRSVTISLGVGVFPQHGASVIDLVRAADQALYQAKTAGRNQVVVASPGRSENA